MHLKILVFLTSGSQVWKSSVTGCRIPSCGVGQARDQPGQAYPPLAHPHRGELVLQLSKLTLQRCGVKLYLNKVGYSSRNLLHDVG